MDSLVQNYELQNIQNGIIESLLKNKENLVKFYYDLTDCKVNLSKIKKNTISTSFLKGENENVVIKIDNEYLILIQFQNTWSNKQVIHLFNNIVSQIVEFIEKNYYALFIEKSLTIPNVEAYIIYTGFEKVPNIVNSNNYFPNGVESLITTEVKVKTSENAVGLVKDYIVFSQLLTQFYTDNKRKKGDLLEFVNYLSKHKKEMVTFLETYF